MKINAVITDVEKYKDLLDAATTFDEKNLVTESKKTLNILLQGQQQGG